MITKAINVILTDEVLAAIEGIIIGKPYLNRNYECYKNAFIKRIKQSNNQDIPILYNLSFGHNEPKMILPYGLYGEIDCKTKYLNYWSLLYPVTNCVKLVTKFS